MQRFDYIVIGGGSAGAAVAARLSEDPDVNVLLLEAGGARTHRHPLIRLPIGFLKAYRRKQFSISIKTEPEPELGGRQMETFRGRALGGSSNVNGMMYNRGNASDYDEWRDLGAEGWGYADVLPYFKRLETSWRGEGPYHGGSGPIGVKLVADPQFLYEDFEASAVLAGHQRSDDVFGETTSGVTRLELNVGDGERASSARCYLDPAMARPNFTVMTHAQTTRVVIDKCRAVGVEYRRGGETVIARAEREVIVSAGSFHSPQLLMLSGVGPANHLRETGITPVIDLPGVGANLQEHPMFPVVWNANRADTFLQNLRLDRAARFALQWLFTKRGPFTTTACHGIVFDKSRPDLPHNDIYIGATALGLDADLWFPGVTKPATHRFVAILTIQHPKSRGWVKLRSADPADSPRIFYNFLSDPADLPGLVNSIRVARAIYGQGPQAASIDREALPGAAATSDADLDAYVRRMLALGEHPSGTCRMGIDELAVVDPQLRVRGIEGLRVADASVMPRVTGGNINIPTIMIGEKASDLIRGRSLPPARLPTARSEHPLRAREAVTA